MSPRGFDGVRKAAADLEARRTPGPGAGALWFKLDDSETAIVRFLEQDGANQPEDDIHYAEFHQVKISGRQYPVSIPCCDQENDGEPCPGCEDDDPDVSKKKFLGYINLIWEDAPEYKRDKDKKIVKNNNGPVVVGNEDQVAIWNSGIRLFEMMDEINASYGGLTSRPFKVKRKGTGLDTKYVISPADPDGGKQPMTKAERKLADEKHDLNDFVNPPSYEEFEKRAGGGGGGGGGSSARSSSSAKSSAAKVNPFKRRK